MPVEKKLFLIWRLRYLLAGSHVAMMPGTCVSSGLSFVVDNNKFGGKPLPEKSVTVPPTSGSAAVECDAKCSSYTSGGRELLHGDRSNFSQQAVTLPTIVLAIPYY